MPVLLRCKPVNGISTVNDSHVSLDLGKFRRFAGKNNQTRVAGPRVALHFGSMLSGRPGKFAEGIQSLQCVRVYHVFNPMDPASGSVVQRSTDMRSLETAARPRHRYYQADLALNFSDLDSSTLNVTSFVRIMIPRTSSLRKRKGGEMRGQDCRNMFKYSVFPRDQSHPSAYLPYISFLSVTPSLRHSYWSHLHV